MTNQATGKFGEFLKEAYTVADMQRLLGFLHESGVFQFNGFSSGLFPAVGKGSAAEETSGYRAAWVRDNVHIAYAHLVCGEAAVAGRCVATIADVYLKHLEWFTDVIEGRKSAVMPMNRPHIRFNGETASVIAEKWPHAQNDALGAFMWLLCKVIVNEPDETAARKWVERYAGLLWVMTRYFEKIEFWQDEDSGHWEEQRKISASSIGVVVAGLTQYCNLIRTYSTGDETAVRHRLTMVEALCLRGQTALNQILPMECRQPHPRKYREYDGALLFLLDPFEVVSEPLAGEIVKNVTEHLKGDSGIRRYLLDSYWGPDYREVPPAVRTTDFSTSLIKRDAYAVNGKEAQWCIFDSVISMYFGRKYQQEKRPLYLENQTAYLNRALTQMVETGDGRLVIPEAYFLEKGKYVPNDHAPLQWAHANLWRAVNAMKKSCMS